MIITADDSQLEATMHSAVASVAAASAEMDAATSSVGDSSSGIGKGLSFGGIALGITALITPITTLAFSAAAAVVSLAAVGTALVGVGIGAAYFASQLYSAESGASAFDKAIQAIELQLAGLGQSIGQSLGSTATSGIKSLQADLMILISQSAPFITQFIQSLTSLGGNLAQAFLAPGANGQSIFQEWGTAITNLVSGGGAGLIKLFTELQQPALAFVNGITQVIHTFSQLATLSPGIIGITTQVIQQFFDLISNLIPAYSNLSVAADAVSLAILKVANALAPIVNAGLGALAFEIHAVANLFVFLSNIVLGVIHAFGPLGTVIGAAAANLGGLYLILHKLFDVKWAAFTAGLSGAAAALKTFLTGVGDTGVIFALEATFPRIADGIIAIGEAIAGVSNEAAGLGALGVTATDLAASLASVVSPIGLAVSAYTLLGASTVPVQTNLQQIDSLLTEVGRNEVPIQWARTFAISLGATGAAFDAAVKSGQTYEQTIKQLATGAATAQWINEQKQMISAGNQVNAFIQKSTSLTHSQAQQFNVDAHFIGSSATQLMQQITAAINSAGNNPQKLQQAWTQMASGVTAAFQKAKAAIASSFSQISISAGEGVGQFKRAMDQMLSMDKKWAADQKTILSKVGDAAKPFLLFAAQTGPAAFKTLDGAAQMSKSKLAAFVGEFNKLPAAGNKLANTITGAITNSLNGFVRLLAQVAQHMGLISGPQAAALIAGLTGVGGAADGAKGKVDGLGASLGNVGHMNVHPTVTVDDHQALGAIGAVIGALGQVDGMNATATITTVHNAVYTSHGTPHKGQAAGAIIHAGASGFITNGPTLVGEAGYPTFAGTGAEGVIPFDSRGIGILSKALEMALARSGKVQGGDGGEVIHIHGNVYGWDDFRRQVKKANDQNLAARRSIR